jgi:hypothetical protein
LTTIEVAMYRIDLKCVAKGKSGKKARLADLGATALAASPADIGKLIVDEARNGSV